MSTTYGIARAELGYVRNPKGALRGEAVECCRTERRGVERGVAAWDVVERDVVDRDVDRDVGRVEGCCSDPAVLSGGLEEEGTTAALVVLAVVGRTALLAGSPGDYTGVYCADSEEGKYMLLSMHSGVDMSLGVPPRCSRPFGPSWNSRKPGSSRKVNKDFKASC